MKVNQEDKGAKSTTRFYVLWASVGNEEDLGVAQAIEVTPFARQPLRRAHQGSRDGLDVLARGRRRVARHHECLHPDGVGDTPVGPHDARERRGDLEDALAGLREGLVDPLSLLSARRLVADDAPLRDIGRASWRDGGFQYV